MYSRTQVKPPAAALLYRLCRYAFWLSLALALQACNGATEQVGKVVEVHDGDTLTLKEAASGVEQRVRLAGIDAPEKGMPYAEASRKTLAAMVLGREVVVRWHKRDRYGRLVGKVLLDGEDVNLDLIRHGLAWHYKEFQTEQSPEDRLRYAQAEEHARQQGVGLWQEADPVPPWVWRKRRGKDEG